MPRKLTLLLLPFWLVSCSGETGSGGSAESSNHLAMADSANDQMDQVMGTLLETWENRYTFVHNREKAEIKFEVPGFSLLARRLNDTHLALEFEEAGQEHRVKCTTEEAPKVIEALLFAE